MVLSEAGQPPASSKCAFSIRTQALTDRKSWLVHGHRYLDWALNLGVAAGDLAGFPNGRHPGDDVTDLALRVVMGALCHNIAVDLNGDNMLDDADNLNVCGGATAADNEASAPAGAVAFRNGAPQNAAQFDTGFPCLRTPISGSTASN